MIGDFEIASVSLYYYLFLSLVLVAIVVSHRLEVSRIGDVDARVSMREEKVKA